MQCTYFCKGHDLNLSGQVQKLQSIIASRASQYSHDAKRKEREAAKLKERLSQLLVDRKDKKLGNYTHMNIVAIFQGIYERKLLN